MCLRFEFFRASINVAISAMRDRRDLAECLRNARVALGYANGIAHKGDRARARSWCMRIINAARAALRAPLVALRPHKARFTVC